ncbi:MAG: hypothetical protein WBG50_24845, partial [Desulfomonilaceae bacterium]
RSSRDWTPAFAGVTGGEQVITFGNGYSKEILARATNFAHTSIMGKFPGQVQSIRLLFRQSWEISHLAMAGVAVLKCGMLR